MSIWYENVYNWVTPAQWLTHRAAHTSVNTLLIVLASVFTSVIPADAQQQPRTWDQQLEADGFVNVQRINPDIRVQLIYATKHNFTGKPLYKGLTKAWLHPDAANKLNKAQKLLKRKYPHYTLLVYDAARPVVYQYALWNMVKGTELEYYVADPSNGLGRHNYGMAVDVNILNNKTQKTIPMGTKFDFFGEEAHTDNETLLVKQGKISTRALNNRQLLRSVMTQAGFTTVTSEWWHFNACSGNVAKKYYKLIEGNVEYVNPITLYKKGVRVVPHDKPYDYEQRAKLKLKQVEKQMNRKVEQVLPKVTTKEK